jgi:DNA-binding response OmpR family regulator
MVKPLIPDELIARIKALMRRPIHINPEIPITYKNITYNPDKKMTHVGDQIIYLTHKESMILELFLKNQNRIIRRDELISSVW